MPLKLTPAMQAKMKKVEKSWNDKLFGENVMPSSTLQEKLALSNAVSQDLRDITHFIWKNRDNEAVTARGTKPKVLRDLVFKYLKICYNKPSPIADLMANLAGARLIWADLAGADLIGARLIWADLAGANLAGADLREAILIGSNYQDAIRLTEEQLNSTIKTPEELAAAIGALIEKKNNNSITEQELERLPNLFKAALDIGNNGIKRFNYQTIQYDQVLAPNNSLQPDNENGLLKAAERFKKTFGDLVKSSPAQLETEAKQVLSGGNYLTLHTIDKARVEEIESPLFGLPDAVATNIASYVLADTQKAPTKTSDTIATNFFAGGLETPQELIKPENFLGKKERGILQSAKAASFKERELAKEPMQIQ